MTYSERELSLAIVPKTSEAGRANSAELPEELGGEMECLREQIQNVLVKEVVGEREGVKSWADKVIGPEVLREREKIFPKLNEILVEYDGGDIPGLYVVSPGRNGYLFQSLSLINHYLVAHLELRARKGLLNRIPKLRQTIKESGFDEETGLIITSSACLGAICQLEAAAEWAGVGCAGLAAGCLLTFPLVIYAGVFNLVQQAKETLGRKSAAGQTG